MNQEEAIQNALRDLETIANLTLSNETRSTISRAVQALCGRIAALEKKCEESFDAGWAACDQAHEEIEQLESAPTDGPVQ
jgi:hypothetical protein